MSPRSVHLPKCKDEIQRKHLDWMGRESRLDFIRGAFTR